ncbi:MAG TPA: phosphate uptake regulator PhoU [Candidatus Bathyarchaeia archaeon]|nr:phosphate uptake regulator PhoU [Candidatus Bathyarchaeia archaeon]
MQAKQSEETRKVQFTGGSTYIISLPKKWVTQNQLKRGSFVKIREEEEGGLLTIVPPGLTVQNRLDEAAIRVSPKDDTEMIARKIVSAYLAGYNSIHIKADKQQLSTKQRHDMKTFVRGMLVGTEIVTEGSSQLTLQVLLSYPEMTIQSALRRMSIITTSMHKDAVSALKTRDNLLAKEVISTDNEVDRFNLYVTRLLKTATQSPQLTKEIGLLNCQDCLGYRLVTKSVERTADHAVNIAENVLTLKHRLSNDIAEKIEKMSTIAIKMFDTAIESLFRQDYNAAESIIEGIKEIVTLEREAVISSQMDIEDAANLRLIIESVRRTAEYACDIAETVLNLTVDSILL